MIIDWMMMNIRVQSPHFRYRKKDVLNHFISNFNNYYKDLNWKYCITKTLIGLTGTGASSDINSGCKSKGMVEYSGKQSRRYVKSSSNRFSNFKTSIFSINGQYKWYNISTPEKKHNIKKKFFKMYSKYLYKYKNLELKKFKIFWLLHISQRDLKHNYINTHSLPFMLSHPRSDSC